MPRGIYSRKPEAESPVAETPAQVVVQNVPRSTQKVRNYQEHTIPLCLTCDHREEMHHDWKEHHQIVNVRDLSTLKMKQEIQTIREKDYTKGRPCQHACKCTEYK